MAEKRMAPTQEEAPSKRQKSLDIPGAEILTRAVPSDIALEVDFMILDYQAYRGIQAALKTSYNDKHERLDRELLLFEAWFSIFKTRHPEFRPDQRFQLRLALLVFCSLYFHRYTPQQHTPDIMALDTHRQNDLRRAYRWIGCSERLPSIEYDACKYVEADLPLSQDEILAYRKRIVNKITEDDEPFYGQEECVTLLDLLPLLMKLCAKSHGMHVADLSEAIMKLLTDFMRQAYLEQYLAQGMDGCDSIDRTFAWGCYETLEAVDESTEIDLMFRNTDTEQERLHWQQAKISVIDELLLHESVTEEEGSLQARLQMIADHHPLEELDNDVRSYVTDIYKTSDVPILAQIEAGTLEGLTQDETEAFLKQCGLDSKRQWL